MDRRGVACGAFGDGTVFTLEMDNNADVEELRNAIFIKKRYPERYLFDVSELTLYVARDSIGQWLVADRTLKPFLQQGQASGFMEMKPLLPLFHEENLGPNLVSGLNEIHVLVKLPERRVTLHPRSVDVHELLLHHVLVDAPLSTLPPNDHFKQRLVDAYNCDCTATMTTQTNHSMGGELRCMLLNTALPSELVVALHLFRRDNQFMVEKFMGFADTGDVNFLYDRSNGDFRLKVFDPALRPQRLVDSLDKAQGKKLAKALPNGAETQDLRFAQFELETTFGDVEGRAICFESFERPYKRCLNLQARLARAKAVRENWITPYESHFRDFWAEEMSVVEKMDLYYDP